MLEESSCEDFCRLTEALSNRELGNREGNCICKLKRELYVKKVFDRMTKRKRIGFVLRNPFIWDGWRQYKNRKILNMMAEINMRLDRMEVW